MALPTLAGFSVGGTEPIDKRLMLTKAEMLAYDDSLMPSDYFCMCSDDHKMYQYNKNNTVDPVTGKFRVFEGGGSTIQVETLPTASATELGKIYQFIGISTENYLNGSFYKCVTDGTDYSWINVDTFPSWRGTSSELEEVLEDLPTGTRIEVTDDYDESSDGYTKEEIDEMFDVCATNPDGLTTDANSAFSTVDANNGKVTYYRCNTNTPNSGFWWNIETVVSKINDAMFIQQKAMQLGGIGIYVRHSSDEGSTWSNWEEVPTLPTVVNDKYLHTNATTGALEWSDLTNTFKKIYTFGEVADSYTLQTNHVYLLIGNCHPTPIAESQELNGIGLIVTFYGAIMHKTNLSGTIMNNFTISELTLSKGVTTNFRGILYDISDLY